MILNLPIPTTDANAAYELAISSTSAKNAARRAQLTAAQSTVMNAYSSYRSTMRGMGTCAPATLPDAQAEALKWIYERTLTRQAIEFLHQDPIDAADDYLYGYCPSCGVDQVKEVDHYAPQDFYPEFSILPENLIPACGACNQRKSNATAATVADMPFLHPYFHILPSVPLLQARVDVSAGRGSVSYSLASPTSWPADLLRKATHQMERVGLIQKCNQAANSELVSFAGICERPYRSQGPAGVVAQAKAAQATSVAQWGVHHWKTVLYQELSTNIPFATGGLLNCRPRIRP